MSDVYGDGEGELSLNDEVIGGLVKHHIDSLEISQEVLVNVVYTRDISHGLNLATNDSHSLHDAQNELSLSIEAHRAELAEVVDGLELSQLAEVIRNADSILQLQQVVLAFASRGALSILQLSHEILTLTILERSLSSTLVIENYANAFVQLEGSTSGSEGSPGTSLGSQLQMRGSCEEEIECEMQSYIELSDIPLTTSLQLSNPEDDRLILESNIILNYVRGEELHTDISQPNFKILKFNFINMTQAQRDNFIVFYKATAGLLITLTDYCGQEWEGVILDHDIDFEQSGTGYECGNTKGAFDFSFEFEGNRYDRI